MEFLTQMLKERILGHKNFEFHPRYENMQLIILCFADDWMIFTRAELLPIHLSEKCLEDFKVIFGLEINALKVKYFMQVYPLVKRTRFWMLFTLRRVVS